MTSSSAVISASELDLLSHIDRLSTENAMLRFELEWNSRLTSLVDWLAWFARVAGNKAVAWIPRDGSHPAAHPPASLPLKPQLVRETLPAPGDVAIPPLSLDSETLAAGSRDLQPIYPFAVGARTGVVLLQNWPVISGDPKLDREFVRQLLAELALNTPLPEKEGTLPAAELQLVQEMLELRALTDLEFHSPLDMLSEFLRKLTQLVDVDRAALFLKSSGTLESEGIPEHPSLRLETAERAGVETSRFTRIAHAACAIPRELSEIWDRWEQQSEFPRTSDSEPLCEMTESDASPDRGEEWVSTGAVEFRAREFNPTRLIGNHHGEKELVPLPPDLPLRMVARFPILRANVVEGWLLLSSRQRRRLDSSDRSLIDWAGQFMLASFSKAEERNQLETRARRDALTNLANRHTFDVEFPRLLQRCTRDRSPCSLLLVDVDHFKRVNDVHGHLAGDQVLRAVAQRVAQAAQGQRVTDRPLVARYGGEEFAIVLPDVPLAGARRIAEDILHAVRAEPIDCGGEQQLSVTVSIGVASSSSELADGCRLFTAADEALYQAKRNGRNQTILSSAGEKAFARA